MAILVVDDSIDSIVLIQTLLRVKDFGHIIIARSAQEAMQILALDDSKSYRDDIDLILMDVVMPEIDGIQACRFIKKIEYYQDVPIIMVTADTDAGQLQMAFDAGAIDYITKPLNKIELLSRVSSALRLKKEIDKRKSREAELLKVMYQLEEANEKLQSLSLIDGLTGIANRRFFDKALLKEWRRSKREKKSLALAMLDIDFFKEFNDTYGHLNGDECLRQVAQVINGVSQRAGDLAARYGGEEFVFIFPSTDSVGGLLLGERLRSAIEALRIPHSRSAISDVVTASVGVAVLLPEDENSDKLIAIADQALYKAKRNGKNRVVVQESMQLHRND